MKRLLPSKTDSAESTHEEKTTNDDLQNFFCKKFNQLKANSVIEMSDEKMKQKKINLSTQAELPLSENVLQSWEMRRYEDPRMFRISQIVLAVPPAQVSVERAFSALGLILTALRNRSTIF
jgi:hAT family C-terminal dimerisation region